MWLDLLLWWLSFLSQAWPAFLLLRRKATGIKDGNNAGMTGIVIGETEIGNATVTIHTATMAATATPLLTTATCKKAITMD